ncbi:MBL fold metallo-hydrolase [Syntrophomonas curvata]
MHKKLWVLTVAVLLFLAIIGGCASDSDSKVNEEKAISLDTRSKEISDGKLEVFFIDCGQGDAILARSPQGQYMLIDGGMREEGENVASFLRDQGVKQLAVVVGTHPHSDHIGGLAGIIDAFPVEKVYLPQVTHNTEAFAALLDAVKGQDLKISTARQGVEIPLEGVKVSFLAPVGDSYDELNNYSAVLRVEYGRNSFIFTGDAEELSESEMLASNQQLEADVLKVGHHGSSSSTGSKFLRAVAPQYAVIMCGAGNDYGHPHQETLTALGDAGAEVYRTDLNGTIIMTSDGRSINVESVGKKQDSGKSVAAVQPETAIRYIGNKKSLKFHRPDCKSQPAEKNRIYFNSRDKALSQGFSPCTNCQP